MKILLLKAADASQNARIQKIAHGLALEGHEVTLVCLKTSRPIPYSSFQVIEAASKSRSLSGYLWRALRQSTAWISPSLARWAYWMEPAYAEMWETVKDLPADIIYADDWHVLPIAARLKERNPRAYFHYHSAEYALEQFGDKLAWRIAAKPFIRVIEGSFIPETNSMSVVSPAIGEALQKIYSLSKPPALIRNVPEFEKMPFRRTGDGITVLFHGKLMHNRGLEQLIQATTLLDKRFKVVIRGQADGRYVNYDRLLQGMVKELRLEDRITFEKMVPVTDVVRAANQADIGIFTPVPNSCQSDFSLANKIFEYTMAGLALCVSPTREMKMLVTQYENGIVTPDFTPAAIANALNSLKREDIDTYKKKSLEAARELNWGHEKNKLYDLLFQRQNEPL